MEALAIGVQQALISSSLGLEAVKNAANTQKAIANVIENVSSNVPVSSTVGTNIDISV